MMRLGIFASALAGAALLLVGVTSALAQPADPAPGASDVARLADLEAAERWAMEFLASDPRVASFERVGLGEFTVVTVSGAQLSFYLDNLVGRLSSAGADRASVYADYEASLRETLARMEDETEPGPEQLMPVLRHRDYLATFEQAGGDGAEPPYRVFAGEVILLLALDSPASIQIAPRSAIDDLGLDEEAAFARATENLRRFARDLDWEREGGLRAAVLDGNYESSVLLLDEAIDALEADLGGPVAVAIPQRSFLIAVRADRPKDLAEARRIVALAAADPYGISGEMFVRREGRWEVLR